VAMWQEEIYPSFRYPVILIFGSLMVKRARNFIFDWAPFLFILLSYDYLRGFVPSLIPQTHFTEMIKTDFWFFHKIPNQILQSSLFHPGYLRWYDYLATLIYMLHYILPFGFGFLLWINSKRYFKEFVTGLSLLSYAAWITYLIFPTAPPWLANQVGYLPNVVKIMNFTLTNIFGRFDFATVYHNLNPNPVGSFPSMHTAYPFLIFLFSLHFFGKKAFFFLPYVLAVWFSIVYLGEHYVTDIIGGAIYTLIFYFLTVKFFHQVNWQKHLAGTILGKWLNT
ncbi:phosphatase PAP2 family protein, partial [Candidatus Daviesbacteria bacterium]|nr:phosphatase PAP2 family protein [Candidatus Daviesbacteria bacterium]